MKVQLPRPCSSQACLRMGRRVRHSAESVHPQRTSNPSAAQTEPWTSFAHRDATCSLQGDYQKPTAQIVHRGTRRLLPRRCDLPQLPRNHGLQGLQKGTCNNRTISCRLLPLPRKGSSRRGSTICTIRVLTLLGPVGLGTAAHSVVLIAVNAAAPMAFLTTVTDRVNC